MSFAENDVFQKAEGFASTDIPDGLAVNDAEGKSIHFLNPVAGAVYLLCDGTLDVRSIALILKEEFALPEAPLQDVFSCLVELESGALIQKVS